MSIEAPAPPYSSVRLDRYRAIVDDWPALCRSLATPLPPCVWANPLKLVPERLAALLAEDCVEATPVGWACGALRLPHGFAPGRYWGYEAGLYRVQEEASLLPVEMLAPTPGDRILDLCAAPGGKTARIAMALGNRATVVANDLRPERAAAVHDAIHRLGLLDVTTTCHDGALYPLAAGPFDRVLVDVPCSAEGTVRKQSVREPAAGFRRWLAGTQRALLRRAVALCRPGGRIVYSTCTFAPEENEAVVSDLLEELGETVRAIAVDVPGLVTSPGLAAWDGRRFHPDLVHARRLWPHHGDTGGFFAAALERLSAPPDAAAGDTRCDPPPAIGVNDVSELDEQIERFGLRADTFAGMHLLGSGRYKRIVCADHRVPGGLTPVGIGMPVLRNRARDAKLTTSAVMAFGSSAERNMVELTRDEILAYRGRAEIAVGLDRLGAVTRGGYVLVCHRGFVLGLGDLGPPHGGRAMLCSLSPKAWQR